MRFWWVIALAGCGGAEMMTPPPAGPSPVTCDGTRPESIDKLWARYLQNAPETSMGGCAFTACHGPPVGGGGGLRFTNAQEFVKATVDVSANTAPGEMRVQMKDPAASYLYMLLLPEAGAKRMPPNGPYLDAAALDEVRGWICSGP
jgi:hypothetical protein